MLGHAVDVILSAKRPVFYVGGGVVTSGAADALMAVVENQRLSLSLIENGEWIMVRSLPLETNITAQIETLIQRETILENISTQSAESRKNYPVFMHWTKVDEVKTIEIKHRRVVNVVSSQYSESKLPDKQKLMSWAAR